MADYHPADISLSTRFELASRMLDPYRPWGLVSQLARENEVSRKFLYEIQGKAESAILKALEAQRPGRKANTNQIEIDDEFVRRAIAISMSDRHTRPVAPAALAQPRWRTTKVCACPFRFWQKPMRYSRDISHV